MTVYNTNDYPITIIIVDTKYFIGPGQGIDLDILGLKPSSSGESPNSLVSGKTALIPVEL